jgi:hypothetical protein
MHVCSMHVCSMCFLIFSHPCQCQCHGGPSAGAP